MLKTIMACAEKRKVDYSEKLLWCAMKYALCMDEGEATETVIFTLKPRVGELSDGMLSEMLTAVEEYVNSALLGTEERVFAPEWGDVRAWLTDERNARIRRTLGNEG